VFLARTGRSYGDQETVEAEAAEPAQRGRRRAA
jgi:hypothetical protein